MPKRLQVYDEVMRQSQQEEGAFKMLSKIDHTDKRLGDRDLIAEESRSAIGRVKWMCRLHTRGGFITNPLK